MSNVIRDDAKAILEELLKQMTRYNEVRKELPPFDVYSKGFDALLNTKPRKAMVAYILNRTGSYSAEWPSMIKEALAAITKDRKDLSDLSMDLFMRGEIDLSDTLDKITGEV